MADFDLEHFRATWTPRVDQALQEVIDGITGQPGCPGGLGLAMKHAVMAGGKRLRPLLCLAAARAAGGRENDALRAGCAVELLHAYSLVHDDLPAMDDDDVRRGQPTCHRAFGEALAILAGDALLTHAFGLLADAVPPDRAGQAVSVLATAAGAAGMVGGQADDVDSPEGPPAIEDVESVHMRKTGMIFGASTQLGGLAAGASRTTLEALARFGTSLGMAFQVVDDILSWEGDAVTLGRPTGSDREQGRRTYPAVAGPQAARRRAGALVDEALGCLEIRGPQADVLMAIAGWVRRRGKL